VDDDSPFVEKFIVIYRALWKGTVALAFGATLASFNVRGTEDDLHNDISLDMECVFLVFRMFDPLVL
jgi:hypothetical protein